jgi:CRP/FNR family transcriptional regulator, cyclic AMP receptor protein
MQWRLLAGVPEVEIQHLLSVARRRRFSRNEVVFHRDDPGDSLHLIVKGRFAIRIANPRGETVMMGLRGRGDHFGELALVARDGPRAATLVALEDSETFAVRKGEFDRLRVQYPGVNDVLLRLLAGEVRLLDERLLETMYLSADKRLRRRLCELAEFYPRADGATEVPLTQEQLAELAGTSRATVNRVLREEEDRGTIELRRGKTVVRDVQSLAKRGR